MTVNEDLLVKAYKWAKREDSLAKRGFVSQWDQGNWVLPDAVAAQATEGKKERDDVGCGTAFCIAGFVGAQLDRRYASEASVEFSLEECPQCEGTGMYRPEFETVDTPCDHAVHVSEFAQIKLGLGYWESERLFSGGNDIDDIKNVIEELIGREL
jgi:hypothetical protein